MYAKATTTDPSSWLCKCEIPTSTEINGDEEHSGGGDEVEIPVNKIDGAWASKEEYLQAHYELLREDGVSPLRDAVDEVRMEPNLMERDSRENAFIYEKVWLSDWLRCLNSLLLSFSRSISLASLSPQQE